MTRPLQGSRAEWIWPDELDGLVAAPGSHGVLFESKALRVLEVVVRPGEREPRHTHRHPSVLIVDRPARIRYFSEDGHVTDIPAVTPESSIKFELMAPEEPHAVENVDDHDYHAFRVELLHGEE